MIVIPIGTFCQLCGTIERLKYRYMALPFDYIRSNILMINDCINNNFEKFLNREKYFNNFLGVDGYGKDIFIHHNMKDEIEYNKMKKRTKKFMNILDKKDIKVYISLFQNWNDNKSAHQNGSNNEKVIEDMKILYETLNNKTSNFYLIGFINKVTKKQCNNVILKDKNLIIYELNTYDYSKGYMYNDSDEEYFIKCIKNVLFSINNNYENEIIKIDKN